MIGLLKLPPEMDSKIVSSLHPPMQMANDLKFISNLYHGLSEHANIPSWCKKEFGFPFPDSREVQIMTREILDFIDDALLHCIQPDG